MDDDPHLSFGRNKHIPTSNTFINHNPRVQFTAPTKQNKKVTILLTDIFYQTPCVRYLTTFLFTFVLCYLHRCECYDMYKDIIPFTDAWSWQKSILDNRKTLIDNNKDCSDTLIVLQHQPVYTLGTASTENNLNFDIKNPPLPLYVTERGGEVTYHGPGQLVMYPIMNLRFHKMDLHWYLRALEEVVIRVLSSVFDLKASRVTGLTGVWVGDKKLAAIGIRVSRWLTYHGLALNVCTDLSPFNRIVPCGIKDRGVGSIKGLFGDSCSISDDGELIDIAHESLLKEFCEVFQVELSHQSVSSLLRFPKRKQ